MEFLQIIISQKGNYLATKKENKAIQKILKNYNQFQVLSHILLLSHQQNQEILKNLILL